MRLLVQGSPCHWRWPLGARCFCGGQVVPRHPLRPPPRRPPRPGPPRPGGKSGRSGPETGRLGGQSEQNGGHQWGHADQSRHDGPNGAGDCAARSSARRR
ncbi:predicted protein [Streptomyces sp. C]|nr:predicted protein [Streptomyces sp. C]